MIGLLRGFAGSVADRCNDLLGPPFVFLSFTSFLWVEGGHTIYLLHCQLTGIHYTYGSSRQGVTQLFRISKCLSTAANVHTSSITCDRTDEGGVIFHRFVPATMSSKAFLIAHDTCKYPKSMFDCIIFHLCIH